MSGEQTCAIVDGLKPRNAPQSPRVPHTCVCLLLRSHFRGPRYGHERQLWGDEFWVAYDADTSIAEYDAFGCCRADGNLSQSLEATHERQQSRLVIFSAAPVKAVSRVVQSSAGQTPADSYGSRW